MPIKLPDLQYIKSIPVHGPRLGEAFESLLTRIQIMEQQANLNVNGQPAPPPAINSLKVSAQNGHFQIAIQDNNESLFRGVTYHVEHASNPQFTDSHTEHLGPTRNANLFLGNVTRYFKAYSSYDSSPVGPAVYHGSAVAPIAVTGGGSVGGPAFLASQGSGTGAAGVGQSGFGPVPFRSTNGRPPVR